MKELPLCEYLRHILSAAPENLSEFWVLLYCNVVEIYHFVKSVGVRMPGVTCQKLFVFLQIFSRHFP